MTAIRLSQHVLTENNESLDKGCFFFFFHRPPAAQPDGLYREPFNVLQVASS